MPTAIHVNRLAFHAIHKSNDSRHGKLKELRSRGELENFLNQWISKYVLLDDSGSLEMKARFPLREARIEVAETTERPGLYTAVAFLRPHFQLDELSVSLRLVTTLPM